MVALHLHVLPDEVREKMSYVDYQDMIKEIGIKINYESISNLLGNGYCPDSSKIVNESSPFNYKEVDSKGRVKSNLPRVTKDMMIALQNGDKNKK